MSTITSALVREATQPRLFRTAREIAAVAAPKPEWILPGFVAAGAVTELGGPPKAAGKTTLALHGIRAAIHGTDFLSAKTLQMPVVMLSEMSVPPLQEALRNADLLRCEELSILTRWDVGTLQWPAIVEKAHEEARRIRSRFVVVDTFAAWARLLGDAENNSGDALEAIAPLQRIAAAGIGVLVLRHARKGGGVIGESARGSSALTGAVDIVLSLTRPSGKQRPTVRVLEGLSRFTETPASVVIEKISDSRNPLGMGVWSESFVVLGDTETVAVDEVRTLLEELMPTHIDGSKTADELAEMTAKPRGTVLRALEAMPDARHVGKGVKGDPKRYYRSDSDQTPIPKGFGNSESFDFAMETV